MKILIGCPIYKRDWILNHWVNCIKSQSVDPTSLGFIFETSPDDLSTIAMLKSWKQQDSTAAHFEIMERKDIPHYEHDVNSRQWTISKYDNMVNLRNHLLERVREISPDYYFSLDSDILLQHPNTLELLVSHIKEGADAVSPLMFMTPVGDMYPSVMTWCNDGTNSATRLPRYPVGSLFQADVIMAAKMMSKPVYENIDYCLHHQGEDVGWSWNCKLAEYKLYSASYIYAPHIMSPIFMNDFIEKGDNRALEYELEESLASI
jgi:hypothetical protein